MTINQAYQQLVRRLERLYGEGEAKSIARIVFEDAFGVRNFLRQDALSPKQSAQLGMITSRLLAHEPVQYILGAADFYGLKFRVDQRVLIPRPETEELVHWMLETLEQGHLKVLDIGTGSGCIPVTLKKHRPGWDVWAVDISLKALELAEENARTNGVEVQFQPLDILKESQWAELGRFDAIVSNPPYIPRRESALMPENVRHYEPHLALFVDNEAPLVFYRAISRFAKQHLSPGGFLFFEANEFNAGEVAKVVEKQGFKGVEVKQDLNGKERMVRCQLAQ
ncbi:MAG: peptide chain release factor N(5)-glutamine methyltransferase [Phaeodactylibacter sp.]|nr:peptide chain release factor N(5)-glutamine methyltransferase [Phaeodactylibacter sp.]MCB9050328.1 peptide chain release factor N(5)-glutamine methyltransferase [Lewinellaceae bacterium]